MSSYPGSQTKITITHDKEATGDLVSQFITSVMSKQMLVSRLENLLNALGLNRMGQIGVVIDDGNAVSAIGSVTFSSFNTANDTFLINGATLIAVASGATANQWNVGASATAQATNFASAIAASNTALIAPYITAVATTSVVNFTAAIAGLAGNTVTIAKGTDGGSVMTVSGARLTGGLAPTTSSSSSYKFGV